MWKMIISGEGLCNIFKKFRHVSSQFRGKSITISVNWRKAKDSDKKHYFMLQLTFFLNNLGIYSWCKASKSPLDRNVSWLNPLIPHLIAFFGGGGCIFSPSSKWNLWLTGSLSKLSPNLHARPYCDVLQCLLDNGLKKKEKIGYRI